MVVLRSKNEIEGMRRAGDLVARAMVLLRSHVRAAQKIAARERYSGRADNGCCVVLIRFPHNFSILHFHFADCNRFETSLARTGSLSSTPD